MQKYSQSPNLRSQSIDKQQTEEQGFTNQQIQAIIIPKNQMLDEVTSDSIKLKRQKPRYQQPKIKLNMKINGSTRNRVSQSQIQRQDKSLNTKSLDVCKNTIKNIKINSYTSNCIIKLQRTDIGQNICFPIFSLNDRVNLKKQLLNQRNQLIYESSKQLNTHGFIKNLLAKNSLNLQQNDLNNIIKQRMRETLIRPKKQQKKINSEIVFSGDFESSNLLFVSKIKDNQFDIYLKNDTNTHGHQGWFYFRIKNYGNQQIQTRINIKNIRRNLKLFHEGQKIYSRKIDSEGIPIEEWNLCGDDINFGLNQEQTQGDVTFYNLSFKYKIQNRAFVEISLLPAFTYSQMLQDIDKFSKSQNVIVETLTYSLLGLSVPLLTLTNPAITSSQKNIILISCRIHPSETNSSYILRGLINQLLIKNSINQEFLDKNILKIIPMLNPDGVIYGNFRTNLLGNDLNRCFSTQDQYTNPQVFALKSLGVKLKEEFGNRFTTFIDMHGHSTDKDIFTYGPDYDSTQNNLYQIRLLPKILSCKSKYFNYNNCTYKLQQSKKYTARGFFLNSLKINSYTIEASYAFYTQNTKHCLMTIKDLNQFGQDLAESLTFYAKIIKISPIKSRYDFKKVMGEIDKQNIEIIKKFTNDFEKQKIQPSRKQLKYKQKQEEDSDGEDQSQDFNLSQRQEIIKQIKPHKDLILQLPKILKQSIIYPVVTPSLFKMQEQSELSHLKILFSRRNKYNSLRMQGNSSFQLRKDIEHIKLQSKSILQ